MAVNFSETNNLLIKEIKYRFLRQDDVPEMYKVFRIAFSDYHVPFNLTRSDFDKKFLEKLNLNFEFSPGAFHNDKLIGFIFTSVKQYEGRETAYNGGTGVIPEFRGIGIVSKLYHYSIPVFKANGIEQCVLEVLTDNQSAINAYAKCGFKKTKYFNCFKLNVKKPGWWSGKHLNNVVEIIEVDVPDWKNYTKFFDFIPSFLDTQSMIDQNIKNEKIIEARKNKKLVGYAIYQPGPGRISHIGVNREYRRNGVGTMLVDYIYGDSENKHLSIININETATVVKDFFLKLGFENQLNQFEMILNLNDFN